MDENYKLNFKKTRENGKFKFIDLFAGIGGIRIPFDELGGDCVFTSEWDKFAQQTYYANFGEIPEGDITKIPVETIPPHDILLAGFPCQPFSMAGKKKGFFDTRGTLFFNIEKIIEYHKPSVVFLENVKNLRNHDKGRTFQVIKEHLEKLGYKVFDTVLNAKEFGVPQNRERIYIICFKDNNTDFKFPTPPKTKVKVGDILEKKMEKDYTLSDKLWQGHQKRKEDHKKKGNGFGFSLFDSESPYTSTITARYYKDGAEILIKQEGKNPRKVTPREAARLQGFPDTFKIPVSDTQAYKQFGNSVAVPVIRAVAKEIFKHINFDNKKNAD